MSLRSIQRLMAAALALGVLAPACAACIASNTALVEELRSLGAGRVITPASGAAYNDSLQGASTSGLPSDLGITPAIIVRPEDEAHVTEIVRFAVARGLPVSVRGGGHSLRALYRLVEDGVMIDMSGMRAVSVNTQHRTARVQGGAIYADIQAATAPYKLALPWGDALQTGVGLALHGGIGYLSRAYGLTADNVLAARIVIANGSTVTADAEYNPDLLGAMRGAGSVFGVVTELTVQLYDVTDYVGGHLVLFDDESTSIHRMAHEWALAALASEPTLGLEMMQTMMKPGQRATIILAGMPNTTKEHYMQLMEPLRRLQPVIEDTLGQLDYYQFEEVVTGMVAPSLAVPRLGWATSALLTFEQANNSVMAMLPELVYDELPAGVESFYLSDYLANTLADNAVVNTTSFTPFRGDVDMHYFILYLWDASGNSSTNAAFAESRRAATAPHVGNTQAYVNLASVSTDGYLASQLGGEANLAQLRRLKMQLDPTNFFTRHPFVGLWKDWMGSLAQETGSQQACRAGGRCGDLQREEL